MRLVYNVSEAVQSASGWVHPLYSFPPGTNAHAASAFLPLPRESGARPRIQLNLIIGCEAHCMLPASHLLRVAEANTMTTVPNDHNPVLLVVEDSADQRMLIR